MIPPLLLRKVVLQLPSEVGAGIGTRIEVRVRTGAKAGIKAEAEI